MKVVNKIQIMNQNINIVLPSSKSVLNRSLVLASMQDGETLFTNVVDLCDDVNALIVALQQLGIDISITDGEAGTKVITVLGRRGVFNVPNGGIINCGLGGTTTRFLLGLSLLFDFDVEITATGKMLERPVDSLIDVIRTMRKEVCYLEKENCLPVKISGKISKNIEEIEIDCSKSSQFLSAILLVADKIGIKQVVAKNVVSKTYVDITKSVLGQFGIDTRIAEEGDSLVCYINNLQNNNFPNRYIDIEVDWSSASYFLALEYLFNTKIKMNIFSNTSSQGDSKFVEILQTIDNFKNMGNYQYNTVLEIDMETMPDTSMTAMVVCAFQDFTTKITGLGTLKNKECNRLKAMQDEFKKIGIKIEISTEYDAITIFGNSKLELEQDVEIETYNDHRIAMCFAIVGAKLGHIVIINPNVVNKSFPAFWKEFEKCYK